MLGTSISLDQWYVRLRANQRAALRWTHLGPVWTEDALPYRDEHILRFQSALRGSQGRFQSEGVAHKYALAYVSLHHAGLCVLRAICGLGLAIASPAAFGIVGVCFRTEPGRTIAFAASGLGAPLGAACGTPIAGAIAATGTSVHGALVGDCKVV